MYKQNKQTQRYKKQTDSCQRVGGVQKVKGNELQTYCFNISKSWECKEQHKEYSQ